MRKSVLPALTLVLLGMSGCVEETPTGAAEGLLPVTPVTVEIRLPWSQFATGLQVFGGFGSPTDRGLGVVANDFGGSLQARTLGRWEFLGLDQLVNDTLGNLVLDSVMRPKDTRIIVFFDTLASSREEAITLSAHRTLTAWDQKTATWTHAVDSTGDRRLWPEAGGGPAVRVGEGVWERSKGDSLVLTVDTAAVRAWADTLEVGRGFRLDADTRDVRLEITALELRYSLTPSVRPDTTIDRVVRLTDLTFIYTPQPGAPTSGLRVGGIPAWRSVINIDVPETLNGPAELCVLLGCPFELTPERVNHASLVLQTRPSDPLGFMPIDTVRVDVRPVFAPDRLPKAPLGLSIAGPRGRALSPLAFQSSIPVSIPITAFVRAQLAEDPNADLPPARAIALLSYLEPASISFVNFVGPGQPGEPYLRLIVTASPKVELP